MHSKYPRVYLEQLETKNVLEALPIDEWTEDDGPCLWWEFPITSPPYVGSPLWEDFPSWVTHFTPIIVPPHPTEGIRPTKACLTEAENIHELDNALGTIEADEDTPREDIPKQIIIDEALHILECYREGGHTLNEELSGEWGKDAQKDALSEIKRLKAFIKKWA